MRERERDDDRDELEEVNVFLILHDAVLDDEDDELKYELELVERDVDITELVVPEQGAPVVCWRLLLGGIGGGGGLSCSPPRDC
mgnify:CR=1 FL=1